MSSRHGPRPTYVIATWEEAEEVRRAVRERGWAAAARRLGWPESNARQNIAGALRRAPEPPPPTPEEAAREAAVRRAEEDPVLGRRCAKCGAKGYRVAAHHFIKGGAEYREYHADAVPMTRLGGRWLCDRCVPRRRRAPEGVCAAFAEPYGPAK